MPSDDRTRQTDDARQKLLQEIKRRAEEAELRRLEEEERSPLEPSARHRPQPPQPTTPPIPTPGIIPPVARESDARLSRLREEFSRMIDLRDPVAAAHALEECRSLNVDTSEITAMRIMLDRLEEELQQLAMPAALDPPPTAEPELPAPVEPEPSAPVEPEIPVSPAIDARQIADLLQQAEFNYQHERYAEAVEILENVLSADPNNPDAQNLRRAVARAIELSERIASEDARSRESLLSVPAPSKPGQPPVSDVEVWGSSVKPLDTMGFDTLPEQEGLMPAPKPSMGSRLIPRLAGIGRFLRPLALIVLVAVAAIGVYFLVRALSSTVVPTQTSLLILPAVSTGGDPAFAQITEGFSDDVVRKLGLVSDLRIVAPVSAAAAGMSSWSPPQAARAVKAGLCLAWNMSIDVSVIHIQQALYDSTSTNPIWSKKVDVPVGDLSVQRSEILGSLIAAVNVHTSEEEQVALHKIPTTRSDAYDAYLHGRAILRHPDAYPISAAVAEFEQAIALDSLFGEAYASLGWARVLALEHGDTTEVNTDKAVYCVQRAVALGFRNAEAFRTWGALERHDGQILKAGERFDEAVQIAPSDAEARRRLAQVQIMRGQLDAAIASAQRALKDDPLNVDSYTLLGLLQEYSAIANNENKDDFTAALATLRAGEKYAKDGSDYGSTYLAPLWWYLQNPDDAIAILSDNLARTRESYDGLYLLGRVQQAAGRPKQEWQNILSRSKATLQDHLKGSPSNPVLLSWLSLVDTRLGEFKEAVAASKRALEQGSQNPVVLYNTARMYALQRNGKSATEYLRRAADRDYDLVALLDMDLFNLHGEPEYLKSAIR